MCVLCKRFVLRAYDTLFFEDSGHAVAFKVARIIHLFIFWLTKALYEDIWIISVIVYVENTVIA